MRKQYHYQWKVKQGERILPVILHIRVSRSILFEARRAGIRMFLNNSHTHATDQNPRQKEKRDQEKRKGREKKKNERI
jgi:hypothetical protein